MKTLLLAGALAASFVLGGCASQSGASYAAVGETENGILVLKDGKRQEALVGSRLARETRENSESVKSVGRKGYKESQIEKSGSPLDGGQTAGRM